MTRLLLGLAAFTLCWVTFAVGYKWAKKQGYEVPASYGYSATAIAAFIIWAFIAIAKHYGWKW